MKKYSFILFSAFTAFACNVNGDNESAKITAPLSDSLLSERWKVINIIADSIREGDLVLRCGNDFISESLSDFSQKEKLYSHSGIAMMDNGTIYIYSNMAGDINPDEIMRRDIVDSFITPVHNIAVGVYRYDITPTELEKLKTIVHAHYMNKLQFDMNFDLSTDDKMYCAEMIAKSVEQATEKRITFSKSLITPGLKEKYLKKLLDKKVIPSAKVAEQREYLALDDLYMNPHCREVTKIVFDKPKTPTKFPTPEKLSALSKPNVIVYTDGASRGNPGPGGYGSILIAGSNKKELSQGYKKTTNNRMELMAVIAALEALKKDGLKVVVYSDSKYVVDSVEKGWLNTWIATDFKGGKKNKDLWLRFYHLAKKQFVRFVWVKGHADNPNNNRCDQLATEAADSGILIEDEGFESKGGDLLK